MEQNWTNTFVGVSHHPYMLIAAGSGAGDVPMPDGSLIKCEDVKRELVYPQLLAWNAEGKSLLNWVKYMKEHPEYPGRLVVDSGAYSAWSKGKPFDMNEYIDFLDSNDVIDTAFWCAEADVIPGHFGVDPTEEEREAAPESSWKNYLYMIDKVRYPKKIVPIFHMGEDFKHLKRMLEYTFKDGDHIPYIGLSPRNDVAVSEKKKWYELTWKIIKESSNPNVLTHNFGCTTISIMEQYPSMSSDSTSWLRYGSFGNIILVVNGKIKPIYVGSRRPTDPDYIMNMNPAVQEAVENLCKKIGHGLTLKYLVDTDTSGIRMVFNLYSLNEWRNTFSYEGNDLFKTDLW